MFIDGLAGKLDEVGTGISDLPANLCADDVQLLAKVNAELRILLRIADNWAKNNEMHWASAKSTILSKHEPEHALKLASQPIVVRKTAKYLGVQIDCDGIANDYLNTRISRAFA